jgi:hypothetical protein
VIYRYSSGRSDIFFRGRAKLFRINVQGVELNEYINFFHCENRIVSAESLNEFCLLGERLFVDFIRIENLPQRRVALLLDYY